MKRYLSLLIAGIFAMTLAAESGTLPKGFSWSLVDSTLTLYGTGKSPSYNSTNIDKLPWQDPRFAQRVHTIVISEGITEIGAYLFGSRAHVRDIRNAKEHGYYATQDAESSVLFCNLRDLKLPSTLRKIGHHAFCRAPLTHVYFPESIVEIAAGAFTNTALELVILPSGLTKLGPNVFESCQNLRIVDFNDAYVKIPTGMLFDAERLRGVFHTSRIRSVEPSAFGSTALEDLSPEELLKIFHEDGLEAYLKLYMPTREIFNGTDEDYENLRMMRINDFYNLEAQKATSTFKIDRLTLMPYNSESGIATIETVHHGTLLISLTPEQAELVAKTWQTFKASAQPIFLPSNGKLKLQSVNFTLGLDTIVAAPLSL